MSYDENAAKEYLHRHLQGYTGQTLSYEMVKELMTFVFDMVKDPDVSWVSKDSHIRLLNGIFKRIGQTVDDKSIAGIEESVCSAFVFHGQNEMYNSAGKLVKPGISNEASIKPAQTSQPEQKDKSAGASDSEILYQRLLQELVSFENKIIRFAEAASLESRSITKRMAHDRIELEARLAIERAELVSNLAKERDDLASNLAKEHDELVSGFSKERAGYESRLAQEHAELAETLNTFLYRLEEQSFKARNILNEHIQALEFKMDSIKDTGKTILSEHTAMQTTSMEKAQDLMDVRWQNIEQKLQQVEERMTANRRAIKRMNVAAVVGMIVMVAGFLAVIYFRAV